MDFGRKWQLIHEHVTPNRFYWWVILFHISAFFPLPFLFCFCFALVLVSKVLFTQECRKCWLCSARLSKWYWWLRTRCLTDWWCCEKSAHFLPLDTIRQRWIFSFRTHFAFRGRGACRIPLHFSHTLCSCYAYSTQIITLTLAVEGEGGGFLQMHTGRYCTVWEAMTNNGSGKSLSSHVCCSLPLIHLKVHTHHKCRPTSIPAHCSSPPSLRWLGCTRDCYWLYPRLTWINLELLPCHPGIILNNVHNCRLCPSPAKLI